tara:strand:- start:21379 stop:21666 length:288 start_codon:yes stop_codon:yes gene_type:complete
VQTDISKIYITRVNAPDPLKVLLERLNLGVAREAKLRRAFIKWLANNDFPDHSTIPHLEDMFDAYIGGMTAVHNPFRDAGHKPSHTPTQPLKRSW